MFCLFIRLFIDAFIFSEAFNQAEIQFLVILSDDYSQLSDRGNTEWDYSALTNLVAYFQFARALEQKFI